MPYVQLAIFVLDASGSMADPVAGAPHGTTKAWQIEEMLCLPLPKPLEGVKELEDKREVLEQCGVIARLQASSYASYIYLAIIRYDTKAVIDGVKFVKEWTLSPIGTKLEPPKDASSPRYLLDGKTFDLLSGLGGATNIACGLREARNMANDFIEFQKKAGFTPLVSIVLMSDMLHNEGPKEDTLSVAKEIRQTPKINERPQILLAAVAFGDDADLNLMEEIAGDSRYALKTTNPVELRRFFIASATR